VWILTTVMKMIGAKKLALLRNCLSERVGRRTANLLA
jgi:hypothetical protein